MSRPRRAGSSGFRTLLGLPALMPRKLVPLAFLLVLTAAACAEPPTATVDVGSGVRFLPAVADSLNDVGRHPAVVVNDAGLPVVAYFGFQEELAEGEIAPPRPIGAPTIPGVFLATVSEEGYWTRGAMAIAEPIANVNVAFNPAFEPSLERLAPDNVTGLAMVADGDTYHAVFGSAGGVWYATGSLDPATSTQVSMTQVSPTPGVGPSIALVDGAPWIAFYSSTSSASTVELAVPDGDAWQVDSIADAGGCDTCRTAIVATEGGPAVAYSDGGDGVSVATNDGENAWVSFEVVAEGGSGALGRRGRPRPRALLLQRRRRSRLRPARPAGPSPPRRWPRSPTVRGPNPARVPRSPSPGTARSRWRGSTPRRGWGSPRGRPKHPSPSTRPAPPRTARIRR